VVYSEHPGFTAFVDERAADDLNIPRRDGLTEGLYSAPLDVHLSLTTRCNLRCAACYARSGDAGHDMPLAQALAILDRLAAMNVLTVALGGGEPLLHPDLFAIADYARAKQIAPNLTTNAVGLDSALAERCRVFASMHVSCHDPSECERLGPSIALLQKAGIDVGLNLLVTRATLAEFPMLWAWAARQKIRRILLLKFKQSEHNRAAADLALSPDEEQSLLPVMKKLARRHRIMPMLDCSLFPALARHRPKRRDLEFFDVNGCVRGNAILAITVDGRFKPCSFWPEAGGDAVTLDEQVWRQNDTLRACRESPCPAGCDGCTYIDLCRGGCRVCNTPWCQSAVSCR